MSKRLILIFALAFVVGIAASAHAEVQNVTVGGEIIVQGVSRDQVDFLKNSASSSTDSSGYMATTTLDVAADLTDDVSAVVQLANERDWGNTTANAAGNRFEVWLSYVTLRSFLNEALTLTVGTQAVVLGNGLVLADANTNQMGGVVTATNFTDLSQLGGPFDAIRADLDYDPLTITLLTAKVSENAVARTDDADVYAVNAAYLFENGTLGEAYCVAKNQRNDGTTTILENKVNTFGLRAAKAINDNLSLQGEVAIQTGELKSLLTTNANQDRDAMAAQVIGTYAFDAEYSPVVTVSYTYLSGDSDTTVGSGDRNDWDTMYEAQSPGPIANALFAASNCHVVGIKGSVKPADDVTVNLNYANLSLDKKLNVNNVGTTAGVMGAAAANINTVTLGTGTTYAMTSKKDLGDEVDLEVIYDYTEDVQLSLCGGLFFPGDAFASGNEETASQVVGSMKVTF